MSKMLTLRRGLLTYRYCMAFSGAWGAGRDLVHAFCIYNGLNTYLNNG